MLRAALEHEIDAVITWELADELSRVLSRPKLKRYAISGADVASVLSLAAPLLPTVELHVAPRDRGDLPVIAAAINGNAEIICTGDRDLLDDAQLRAALEARGIRVMEPRELAEVLARSAP